MIYLKDPKTKQPSVTLTAFVAGFCVAVLKLFLSGIQITPTYKFPDFSGVDFAAVVGALGAVYTLRRNHSEGNNE
jgi:hypothetical protein